MFLLPVKNLKISKTKNKGLGVFTKKEIKKGTVIADYLGNVIKTADYNLDKDKKGLFLMYLTDNASIYPDLNKPGPHLINHSCEPNCWIYIYQGHTLFFALRNINPGEELTISYLLSPNNGECKKCTHNCNCQSKNCTKTMHLPNNAYKKWQKFQREQKKVSKTASFSIGKKLEKLNSYPKTIKLENIYFEIIDNISQATEIQNKLQK